MNPNATGHHRTPTNTSGAWVPTMPHAKRLLDLYGRLVTDNATEERIRWEMGLSERQILRYAAAWRHQQQNKATP